MLDPDQWSKTSASALIRSVEEEPIKGKDEDIRTGTSPVELKQVILDNLYFIQGRLPVLATQKD